MRRRAERGLAPLDGHAEALEDPAESCLVIGAKVGIKQLAVRVYVVLEPKLARRRWEIGGAVEGVLEWALRKGVLPAGAL